MNHERHAIARRGARSIRHGLAAAAAAGLVLLAASALQGLEPLHAVTERSGAAAVPASTQGAEVTIGDYFFAPDEIRVQVGDTVTWTNEGAVAHTTTSSYDPPIWDSGSLSTGEVFTHTFTSAGTYLYECTFHAAQMQGSVVVERASPTASATVSATETAAASATPEATATPLPAGPEVGLEPIASGLTSPVALRQAPDGTGRLFIVDQVGLIHIVGPEGERLPEPFLDLRDRMVALMDGFDERGLLGLAFPSDFGREGRFFVYYSAPLRDGAPEEWNHTSHLSAFRVSEEDPNRADPASEQVILQVDQPQFNHDGGTIAFGPDGYLYVALGDGGGANDAGMGHGQDGNGQDPTTLLGSILRIDVVGAEARPYKIPDDNPFVDDPEARDEIYAYGLRNPFRIAFDPATGWLYAGDVGQNLWEEVDIVRAGQNYGWNLREGRQCFDPENPSDPPDRCADKGPAGRPLVDPVIEYLNANAPGGLGYSVIGGVVYRGSAMPSLTGRYLFGDWASPLADGDGLLLVASPGDLEDADLWPFERLRVAESAGGGLGAQLLAFGQDLDGEAYVLTSESSGPTGNTGRVRKLVPAGGTPPAAILLPLALNEGLAP